MRNKYRPVAIRGALIYFVVADLASIDPMYQVFVEGCLRVQCCDARFAHNCSPAHVVNVSRVVLTTVHCFGFFWQYSLSYFSKLFGTCIDDAEKSSDLDKRLTSLINYLTSFVYKNVCRGLFEAHKLLFSFLISISILRTEGVVRRCGESGLSG